MNNVNALGSSTIHAQGLEGLDGVEGSEFDKCLDDVEAPNYCFVMFLKETTMMKISKAHSSKKISSVDVSPASPRAYFCPLIL